ncbi:MAG: hypothetical protein ACJA0Q_001691 [Saprospiraceae bacterium]|jgi:hypothetical protein
MQRKQTIYLTLLILTSFIGVSQTAENNDYRELVWEENWDFLDHDNWWVLDSSSHPVSDVVVHMASEVNIDNGELVLTAKYQPSYCGETLLTPVWGGLGPCNRPQPTNYEYIAGRVMSKEPLNALYGFIEARIKTTDTPGTFPAFWTYIGGVNPEATDEEIDIFELLPGKNLSCEESEFHKITHNKNILTSNLHGGRLPFCDGAAEVCDDCTGYFKMVGIDDYTKYHTYGLEWSPNRIIWYIDSVPVRVEKFRIPIKQSIIFNQGIQENNPPASTSFHAEMRVDWVRYYSLKEGYKETLNPKLYQSYPNPFSQDSEIIAEIPEGVNKAVLMFFNVQGQVTKTIEILERGTIKTTIKGCDFSPGIYIYALFIDGKEVGSKKMVSIY